MKSVRTRIVVWFVAGAGVALAVTVIVAVFMATRASTETAYREASELVHRYANQFDADRQEELTVARTLARTLQAYRGNDRSEAVDMLRETLKQYPGILGFSLGYEPNAFDGRDAAFAGSGGYHDQTGRFVPYVFHEGNGLGSAPLVGYDEKDWYVVPEETKKEFVTNPYLFDGTLMITYSVPIMDEDGFRGIASAHVGIDYIDKTVGDIDIYETGYAFMASRTGALSAFPVEGVIGRQTLTEFARERNSEAFLAVAEALADGTSGYVEGIDPITGKEAVLFYAPLETTADVFVAVLPQDEMLAGVKEMVHVMLLVGLLAILAIVALGFFIGQRLSRPIIEMSDAAGRVAAGDVTVQTHVRTQDELGRLSRDFNVMVASIRASMEKSEHSQAVAEQAAGDANAAREAAENQGRYLSDSVAAILLEMEAFSKGDLTRHLTVEKNDEIGQLFEGFNQAVQTIGQTLYQVNAAVDATASAATQISSSTEELAAGSQEQSSQAGEVAAAVEQMSRTIVDNSRGASEAAAVADNSGRVAAEGGRVVGETVRKIEEIAAVVSKAAETVQRLGTSSEQIGEITAVIDGIADQTNLLALNAAIEAARAGEHGRGFAVVADEVRKLAERTGEATKQIADMIRTIQRETEEAVNAMSRGSVEVDAGIRLAGQARQSLDKMVAEARAVVDRVTQIAAASEEQSATSEQISRSVDTIATVSNQSAAGVTQIARATDDLNRLTLELKGLVSSFKIGAVGEHASAGAARPPQFSGDGANRLPILLG